MSGTKEIVNELLDSEQIGREIEKFLGSKAGDYLIRKSNEAAEQATNQLIGMAVLDEQAIIRLQERIKLCRDLHNWLADGIVEGETATGTLAAMESND